MLFNSLAFACFLPIVFALYWLVFYKEIKARNIFLILASYFFYACWDWRFLILIFISSGLDYTIGLLIQKTPDKRLKKRFLALSILVNLGFLGVFKYFGFFFDSFVDLLNLFGFQANHFSLKIILPVGISFYTFQTLSYTIDVYRQKIEPCKDYLAFFAFVSFFPQLVAGPIERAKNLLPQFYQIKPFQIEKFKSGLQLILWGLFKKMVIADNCAIYANQIFEQSDQQPSVILIMGAVYFAFQIYGDFSGYSDIAIGTAKLFGFQLMQNFNYPYFSRDIAEFWRRWHISLSTWFRDYVYIPLGGNRTNSKLKIRNIFIVFLLSGFWHGANWTFLFWGFLNALYYLPLMLWNKNRKNLGRINLSIKAFFQILITFFLTCLAWIFFRAENLNQAFNYLKNICFKHESPAHYQFLTMLAFLFPFLVFEWFFRDFKNPINAISNKIMRYFTCFLLIILIYFFYVEGENNFIYFQF